MEPAKLQTKSGSFASGGEKAGHLNLLDLVRLSLRIFRAKPTRTFLTVLGMSMGIGVVLFLISLGYGLQYLLIGRIVTTEDSLITLEAYYAPDSNLSVLPKDVDRIKSLPGFQEISPVGEFPAEMNLTGGEAPKTGPGFLLARIVPYNYDRLSGVRADLTAESKNPADNIRGVVVTGAALKTLGLAPDESALGRDITLDVFYPAPEGKGSVLPVAVKDPLRIQGIITDETQPPFIIVPQRMLGDMPPPFYQSVFVKAKDIDALDGLRNELLGMGLLVSSRVDMVNQVKKVMSIVTTILGIFGITALIVSAIGMFNTMLISFLERIFEVGIMKAIGATNRDIRNLFLAESFMMGLMGGVGGILLGIGLGNITNFGVNTLARSFGGKPLVLFIRPWWFLGLVLGIAIIIGEFSGFWPARRAAKVSPEEAFLRK